MNDVTAIIPVYNEKKFIKKAILSIVNQVEEVMICDNHSTDGTIDILIELANIYKNITLILQDKNYGISTSMNIMYNKVSTKYLMIMGSHDFIADNYIKELKNAHKQDKSLAIAYAPSSLINENGETIEEKAFYPSESQLNAEDSATRILTFLEHPEFVFCIFGLLKTQIVKQYRDQINVAGRDRINLSIYASLGKFYKVKSTKFYRRVLNRDDSDQAYMKRFTNDLTQIYDLSYMCEKQLNLLKEHCSAENLESYMRRAQNYFEQKCYRYYDKYKDKAQAEYDFLKELNDSDEKFILYGAGMEADYTIRIIQDSLLFLADIDPAKHSQKKTGFSIKPPQSLLAHNERIIISHITNFDTILHYLLNVLEVDPSRIVQLPTQKY